MFPLGSRRVCVCAAINVLLFPSSTSCPVANASGENKFKLTHWQPAQHWRITGSLILVAWYFKFKLCKKKQGTEIPGWGEETWSEGTTLHIITHWQAGGIGAPKGTKSKTSFTGDSDRTLNCFQVVNSESSSYYYYYADLQNIVWFVCCLSCFPYCQWYMH